MKKFSLTLATLLMLSACSETSKPAETLEKSQQATPAPASTTDVQAVAPEQKSAHYNVGTDR